MLCGEVRTLQPIAKIKSSVWRLLGSEPASVRAKAMISVQKISRIIRPA